MPDPYQNHSTVLRWVTYFGLLGWLLGVITAINRIDPDMFHEMALFREALAIGRIPGQDVFAYTPTVNPIIHHEWGAGAIFYAISMSLGGPGVILTKYTGAIAVGLGCFVLAKRRGASEVVFALLAPVAIFCGCIGLFSVRAQLFTLLLTLCLLYLLEEDRKGRRWWPLAWLPIYVVWLNVHGGFLVGAGLFAIYTSGRFAEELVRHRSILKASYEVRHLLVVAAAMVILFGCNPYGWSYAPYLWHALRLERPFIAEWQGLWHHPLLLLVYATSLLPIVYVARKQLVSAYPDLLMIFVPAVLAFQHVRHLSIYALVWACYVPPLVDRTELGQLVRVFSSKHRTLVIALCLTFGTIGIVQATRGRFWELRIPTTHAEDTAIHYPAGAVDYLKEHEFSGNVMVPFSVGAFVSWKLYPAVKVSCDGRYEVAYPPQQVQELYDFYAKQQNWQQTLERYPPDAVLVPRPNPLEALFKQAGASDAGSKWKLVYRDDGFSLYARQDLTPRLPIVDRSGQQIAVSFP